MSLCAEISCFKNLARRNFFTFLMSVSIENLSQMLTSSVLWSRKWIQLFPYFFSFLQTQYSKDYGWSRLLRPQAGRKKQTKHLKIKFNRKCYIEKKYIFFYIPSSYAKIWGPLQLRLLEYPQSRPIYFQISYD